MRSVGVEIEPNRRTTLNNCLQSPNGYPALLDAENQIHLRANAACTGATTSDVSDEQLSALKQGTRSVTLNRWSG
jgi:hypothetical protein